MTDSPQAWKQEKPSTEGDDRPADPTASLRTFSQGVGFVMQAIGATLFMLTTCACCGIAFWEGDAMHRGYLDTSDVVTDVAPLLLLTNVLGSLALVAFGLGQQSDRGRVPSIGAAVTTTAMTGLYGLVVGLGSLHAAAGLEWPVVVAGVLAVVFLACSALTWVAAGQVWRHPPLSSAAPTVPADAFPDPLARTREKYDSPAQADIAKRRKRLEEEMRDLDDLERRVRNQNRSET